MHTEPESACAQQWKASIHNIADVVTPERCIEELSKPSKESLFDFLDWAMGLKEKKSDAGREEGELSETAMEIETIGQVEAVEHTAY